MIVLADTNMSNNRHLIFNACMTMISSKLFAKDKVVFFGEKKMCQNINEYVVKNNLDNLTYKEVVNYDKLTLSKKELLNKELHQIKNIYKVFKFAKKNNADFLIFFSFSAIGHYFFKKVKKLFPGVKTLVVLHGELDYINISDKNDKMYIMKTMLIKGLKSKTPNTKYMVLGESIRNNFLEHNIVNKDDLICIDHPYIFREENDNRTLNKKLVLGTVGVANKGKGVQNIFEVAKSFKADIEDNKLEFRIIGKVNDDIKEFTNEFVKYRISNDLIPEDEYRISISNLDYILYFYPTNSYKLTASGAFFDSLYVEKPIIALRNDYFEYYFKKFGKIGYLCDDIDDFIKTIKNVKDNLDIDEYNEQIKNIKNAQNMLSLDSIKEDLYLELKKIDYI